MTIADNVLSELKARPYKEVRKQVRNGDILLCSATDPFSKLIRWSTKTPWSHIAIAYRIDSLDRVMVFEAVTDIGVRTVPLSYFIAYTSSGAHPYPGQILLARDQRMEGLSEEKLKAMYGVAIGCLGDKFAPMEIVKIGLRILLGRFNVHLPRQLLPKKEFICSEFVARCFEKAGMKVPWDGLGFVAPGDFALCPEVEAVAQIQTQ
jgi:hypothetical protein